MPENSRDRKCEVFAKGKARILNTGDFLTAEQLAVRLSSQSTISASVLRGWKDEHRIFRSSRMARSCIQATHFLLMVSC